MGKARTAARGKASAAPAGAWGGRARPNPNPFEVKVNRQKFQVLGRKTRHDVGLPGVSRARALQKRTQTLLKEYKERDKSSVFRDKRFGEYSSSISQEEKMMKRFALEQQRQHEKKSIYNLNEDEELTHYGQSLADIEKHNDIVDSDSDAEDRGTLSAELTATHFGGGGGPLPGKAAQQPGGGEEPPKSRRELIEELIARSKQEKRERQAQREDALELTEKLDQDWKGIQALLARKTPKSESGGGKEKPKPDAYDMMVRELGFEMKAQPSSRMKTEEELAREEQERLHRLEAERLRRMLGREEDAHSKRPKHLSADDLNDGFVLDTDDRRLLSYKFSLCTLSVGRASRFLFVILIVPESCEELKSLLSGKSTEDQLLVVERIQKCNHPSLAVGNKAKLEKLFGFLLEYIGDLAASNPPDLGVIDRLVVPLYNLCQMFPESASDAVKFVLRDAMHEMEGTVETTGRAAFPGLDVLIYLKIAGMLFPTSDFWHPVVTPALLCLSQLLTKCPVQSLQDAVKGLFVCCVFLDYVALSQRFIPELINFLAGILHMATPNKQSQGYTLVHPFRALGKNSELLLVSDEEDMATWQKRSLPLQWAGGLEAQTETEANHARLSCLAVCLALVRRCVLAYGPLPSFHDITRPLRALLMATRCCPPALQELSRSILTEMENQPRHYRPLVCEKSKPVPLKLFTPRLVKVLEFGRKQGSTKEEQERRRLIHKHKREFKGAVREIRKDSQFLARTRLSEIRERDAERKRKVKQLFDSLATQEGEWKALKRKKFKK
ncbi:hypothetical protein MJG53_020596 [Ovis ammon polii x Ovis aries]|uniref:Uncharacterized protein n=1 Tax=Ovis ammon polii x Ovis aries TaxID=2918886 RepID=A0ACB9V8C2_9CETA|nr:hypothetical protein MJG53_020596 [Ovis ammon polii x Ovis aries]